MTYYIYRKWGVSLPALFPSGVTQLTENLVSNTLVAIARQTLEQDQDPYRQAREAELHNWTPVPRLPEPSEEELDNPQNLQDLIEWIMTSEEMQEAIMMFRNQPPQDNPENQISVEKLDEEASEELNVEQLLMNLKPTEGDWQ